MSSEKNINRWIQFSSRCKFDISARISRLINVKLGDKSLANDLSYIIFAELESSMIRNSCSAIFRRIYSDIFTINDKTKQTTWEHRVSMSEAIVFSLLSDRFVRVFQLNSSLGVRSQVSLSLFLVVMQVFPSALELYMLFND